MRQRDQGPHTIQSEASVEDSLALYYWDGSQWVREPRSVLDTLANKVTAIPNHFSLQAMLGESRRIYLPLILK